jgi:hypothetical protein
LNLYNVACCYALCVAAVIDGRTTELLASDEQAAQQAYGDQAIASLRQAAARGLKGTVSISSDPDLDAIRGHVEYSKLLDELK